MKKLTLMLSALVFGLSFTSCDSNDDENNTTPNGGYAYRVRMTDAPAPYDEVNIDLQAVVVTDGSGQTTTLNTAAGIYNLLDYSNGLNVAIAEGSLSTSNVQSIRLVLGSNNTVVMNGATFNLATQTGEQGGLTINVNQNLQANTQNEILIDFDAYASVVATTPVSYRLRPVIRNANAETTGRISGSLATSVLLNNFFAVTATSETGVEYSSSVNSTTGQFQISSLPSGTYSVTATSRFTFLPEVMTNVNVQAGSTTTIGLLTLDN